MSEAISLESSDFLLSDISWDDLLADVENTAPQPQRVVARANAAVRVVQGASSATAAAVTVSQSSVRKPKIIYNPTTVVPSRPQHAPVHPRPVHPSAYAQVWQGTLVAAREQLLLHRNHNLVMSL